MICKSQFQIGQFVKSYFRSQIFLVTDITKCSCMIAESTLVCEVVGRAVYMSLRVMYYKDGPQQQLELYQSITNLNCDDSWTVAALVPWGILLVFDWSAVIVLHVTHKILSPAVPWARRVCHEHSSWSSSAARNVQSIVTSLWQTKWHCNVKYNSISSEGVVNWLQMFVNRPCHARWRRFFYIICNLPSFKVETSCMAGNYRYYVTSCVTKRM